MKGCERCGEPTDQYIIVHQPMCLECKEIMCQEIKNPTSALGGGEAGAAHPVLGEVPSLQAVYEKYKHMDTAIGNKELMLNTFANTMLHECWMAIKEAARHFA